MRGGNNRKSVVYVCEPPCTPRGIPAHKDVEKVLSPTGFKISFQTLASSEVLI